MSSEGKRVKSDNSSLSGCASNLESDSILAKLNVSDEVKLTAIEYEFLCLLISNGGCCSKEYLKKELWGERNVSENSLPVLVSKVRKKIAPHKINNSKKHGYSIDYSPQFNVNRRQALISLFKRNINKINSCIIYCLLIYMFIIVVRL